VLAAAGAATLAPAARAFGELAAAAEKAPDTEAATWRLVKNAYLIEDGLAYLNTGTYGPSLRTVFDTERAVRERMNLNFNRFFIDHYIGAPFLDLVDEVAAFVGADRDEISFTSGTTESMSYLVNGLDLGAGDEVLTTTHEHEGGIYPWLLGARRRGYEVRQLPLPSPPKSADDIVDRFASAITTRTRVLSFCHVQYTDGTVMPVRELCELCRDRGVISVVDGAQAVGMLDFEIRDLGCDVYATSLHKWLNGPYGTGLLVLRGNLVDRVWPTVVTGTDGWAEVDRFGAPVETSVIDFAAVWPRALLKYGANLHYFGPLVWALRPAIDHHRTIGRERIEARIRHLAAVLRERLADLPGIEILTPDDPHLHAGLVSFRIPDTDTRALAVELRRDEDIIIRAVTHAAVGFDVNRVCTHIYNTEGEIDRLVDALVRRLPVA
jgi:selenocysteine lyase/cysteine desulfurase